MSERKEFMIEGADLIFTNFSGEKSAFNSEGRIQFSIRLDKSTADQLSAEGWNVKVRPPRDEDEEELIYIGVDARFDIRPPRVVMLSNGGRTRTNLTQETIAILDSVDISNVDLIINGSFWDVNGKQGIKAYLKTMFVTINEDALERKYAEYDED